MTDNDREDGSVAADRFLILMRHAKSDWGDASLDDHDRPLNHRGRRDAPRMALWLSEIDLVPNMVLSSTSQRTRETLRLMAKEWSLEPDASYCEPLYLASPQSIMMTLLSEGGDANRLMVLAHNPGMAHLVSSLSGQAVDMPTAAIAVFRVSLDHWSQWRESTPMKLVQYMRPKAL